MSLFDVQIFDSWISFPVLEFFPCRGTGVYLDLAAKSHFFFSSQN